MDEQSGPVACNALDVSCHAGNAIGTAIQAINQSIKQLGWSLISGAFNGSAGSISATEWNVATSMASKWGLLLLVVVVILGVIRVTQAMIQGNVRQGVSAALWAVCAWPITMLAIWIAITVADGTDRLSHTILSDGKDDVMGAIDAIFNVSVPALKDLPFSATWSGTNGDVRAFIANGIVSLVIGIGSLIAALILSMVLAFRNFALLVLIGFAPIAFMALPMDAFRGWVRSWGQATIALIVAKPLAAGILVMSHSVLASGDGIWTWVTGLVAMVMAAFAPVITMGLFQWAGGQTAANYGSHSSAVATNSVRGVGRTVSAPMKMMK